MFKGLIVNFAHSVTPERTIIVEPKACFNDLAIRRLRLAHWLAFAAIGSQALPVSLLSYIRAVRQLTRIRALRGVPAN